MIKQFWENLTYKEKQQAKILALICLLLFIILFIFFPLYSMRSSLIQEVENQHVLFQWMQEKAPLLKEKQQHTPLQSVDIFSDIEANFKKSPDLINNIVITRLSETKVNINFNNVAFDELINQLLILHKQLNISVEEIQVNKLEKPGLVAGKVVLSTSP